MSAGPGLNEQQAAVVGCGDREVFVSAGAGSGKTRVMAELFAVNAIAAARDLPAAEAVAAALLITFTDKAAGELAERVRRVLLARDRLDLARSVDSAWISTIHGLCQRMVRRHALGFGIDPDFRVLTEAETGVMSHRAFETVATTAGARAEAAALVDAHGAPGIRDAVIDGCRKVRSMGSSIEDLALPPKVVLRDEVRLTWSALSEALRAYEGLAATKTHAANVETVRDVIAGLGVLAVSGRERDAAAVLRCTDVSLKKGGGDAVKTATVAIQGLVVDLRAVAAAQLAHEDAVGLKWLMSGYSEEFGRLKTEAGGLDFDDLQVVAAAILEGDPSLAARYAQAFRLAMVDEFQDTNALEMRIITPLAATRLCVVGDERQSIYRFRHADVDVFRSARSRVGSSRGGSLHELPVNYRTHPDLLEVVNTAFACPALFGDGYLPLEAGAVPATGVTWPAGRPRAELLVADKDVCPKDPGWRGVEARGVASRVADIVREGVAQPGDIVVLLGAMTTAHHYIDALRAAGLRVFAEAAGGFFATPEVADLRALLRVLVNARDEQAVLGLLLGGLGGIGDGSLRALARNREGGGLWGAVGRAETLPLDAAESARATFVHETVESLRREQGRTPLADVLLRAVRELGPGGGMLAREGAWANARKMVRMAAAFEETVPADVAAFLEHLEDREAHVPRERSAGIATEGAEAVRVMTVHAAKGLEFPVVVVADLGHGRHREDDHLLVTRTADGPALAVKPAKSVGDPPAPPEHLGAVEAAQAADLEEAKRLFYVACTRAQEALILAGSTSLSRDPETGLAIGWALAALDVGPGDDGTWRAGSSDGGGALACGVTVTVLDGSEPAAQPVGRIPAGPVAGERRAARAPAGETRAPTRAEAPAVVSYSDLRSYRECPYRFYATRILGMSQAGRWSSRDPRDLDEHRDGDRAGGAREFGDAVHAALEMLAEEGEVGRARLESLAASKGLGPDGADRLAATLSSWRESAAAAEADRRRCRPEVPFVLEVDGHLVTGTIDLYGPGADALIVDYKTGAPKRDAAVARDAYRDQAECYALAALRDGAERVDAIFVELDEGGAETRFSITASDRRRIEGAIASDLARMRASEYGRADAYDEQRCGNCPVNGSLCSWPETGRGRKGRPRKR